MTRLPRNVSGDSLARKLSQLGYTSVRQTGSHLILVTREHGEYHISIPLHNPIQVGTLARLLREIANHHLISTSDVIQLLDL